MSKHFYPLHAQIVSFKSEPAVKARRPAIRYPLEIASGAIDKSQIHSKLFEVQANTSEGLWNSQAIQSGTVPLHELREFLERLEHDRMKCRRTIRRWYKMPSRPILLRAEPVPATADESPGDVASTTNTEDIGAGWTSSPHAILMKLEDVSAPCDELLDAILFAEIVEFNVSDTIRLVSRLFTFLGDQRFSYNPSIMTVVGSAIRKLAMNMAEQDFDRYASLFEPTDTETLPCEIELELAKAVLWRLTADRSTPGPHTTNLTIRLAELASDYLRPRLILQKNYASIALHATLAVVLLGGDDAHGIINQAKSLEMGWFADLLARRLRKLAADLVDRRDPRHARISDSLKNLGLIE